MLRRTAAISWSPHRAGTELICSADLDGRVRAAAGGEATSNFNVATVLAPVGNQEVWAAGVTYYRSRNARMEESKDTGGGDFYDRVYAAERPELFFKAAGWRVVGTGSCCAYSVRCKMVGA